MEELNFDHGWGRLPRLQAKYQAQLKLNQYEGQVLRGIEYYLTGHNKRDDTISLTQLADITKIDRRHISDIVKKLVEKKAIEVKDGRYRMIFYDEVGGTSTSAPLEVGDIHTNASLEVGDIHTNAPFEVGGTWTGKDYISGAPLQDKGAPLQVTRGHLSKTKGHLYKCPPKTLSKDSLRISPNKQEISTKLTEEDLERNKKKALAILEMLKKKYGES